MIFETTLAALQENTLAVRALTAAIQAQLGQTGAGTLTSNAAAPIAAQPGLAALGAQTNVAAPVIPTGITADQITALIQPVVGNEAIKADLGAAMRAMGINGLPETQPHQFGPLYAAFQAVIAKHTQGGQVAAASASII